MTGNVTNTSAQLGSDACMESMNNMSIMLNNTSQDTSYHSCSWASIHSFSGSWQCSRKIYDTHYQVAKVMTHLSKLSQTCESQSLQTLKCSL